MKNKYIINLVFQQPILVKEMNEIQVVNKTTTFEYTSEKEAYSAYAKFNENRFVEVDTPVGTVSYNLLLVEILDVEKLNEQEQSQTQTQNTPKENEQEQEHTN